MRNSCLLVVLLLLFIPEICGLKSAYDRIHDVDIVQNWLPSQLVLTHSATFRFLRAKVGKTKQSIKFEKSSENGMQNGFRFSWKFSLSNDIGTCVDISHGLSGKIAPRVGGLSGQTQDARTWPFQLLALRARVDTARSLTHFSAPVVVAVLDELDASEEL
jgi:hypothetical protein